MPRLTFLPTESSEAVQLFGRQLERAAIDRLIEGASRSRSGVLVLRADAGLGKSALLDYARKRGADMRILQTMGVEPESELPFAALHLLLRPVLSHIDRIPDVQAAALRSALGIAPGEAENRFVVALSVLSLLAELADNGPLLCLVDDAHWLDQSSADTLAFVARRLKGEGIVMLFAAREDEGQAFPGPGLPELRVKGLDPAEAEGLLAARFGSMLAPEIRHSILESAQGNPLALLEIPEELTARQLSGQEPLPQPMPVGHDLEEVFLERVQRLTASVQMLLLVAAAEGSGEADVILSTGNRLGISPAALVDAEDSGLIRAEGDALVFRHPILRSVIYQSASLPSRQEVHRELAEMLQGEANADRRAWHRAAVALHPDDEIADELERTADRARRRSGHAAACGALSRAAQLTSSEGLRTRRLARAARAAWDAGRPDKATALLRASAAETEPHTYAELRHVQGVIEFRCGDPFEGAKVLIEGAGHVGRADPHKALEMLFDAALCANYAGDVEMLKEAGRRVSMLPLRQTDPEAPLVDLLTGMIALLESKDSDYVTKLQLALDRMADVTEPRWLFWAGAAASSIGDQARDDALSRRAETIARRSMAVGTLAMVLERMAWRDMTQGKVAATSLHSEEGLQLSIETGMTNSACFHRAMLAWVAALRGDEEACNSLAEQASETAMTQGLASHNSIALWAVGVLYLGLGQWERAATKLEELASPHGSGTGHPYIAKLALPDLVEAAVHADRPELAESAATWLSDYARDGAPNWEKALAARSQGLITHHSHAREKLFSEALVFHEGDHRLFNRARTLLLLGEHLRRERRRAEARPHLRSAIEIFDRLGARPWEKRARAELRATGETARRREPSTLTQLTPQQMQIVRLVAEGATNKEVAAQLFLSPRTVDYHLRNIFVKLGISSRADLIRLELDGSSNKPG